MNQYGGISDFGSVFIMYVEEKIGEIWSRCSCHVMKGYELKIYYVVRDYVGILRTKQPPLPLYQLYRKERENQRVHLSFSINLTTSKRAFSSKRIE